MATIVVNGTSIQTAVNAAQATGDTVEVTGSGSYAGFVIPTTKRLTVVASGGAKVVSPVSSGSVIEIKGAGSYVKGFDVSGAIGQHGAAVAIINAADVTVEDVIGHDCERGYAFRVFGAPSVRPKLIRVEGHHAALGILVDGGGADGLIDSPKMHDLDRMLVNDPTAGNDTGGQAIGFKRNNGLVTVRNPTIDKAYSVKKTTGPDANEPASHDYGWDGAHFELYESGPVLIEGGRVSGSPIVVETGRSSTGLECRDFTMKGTKIVGEWPGAIPADPNQAGLIRSNKGFLLRSAVNFTFEDLDIRDLDYWLFGLSAGSGYDGTVSGLRIINNTVRLKAGGSRWISWMAGVPLTAIAQMTGNKVYHSGQGSVVAEVQHPGKGQTNDRAVFQGWTGHEATSYWGPEVAVPPPPPVDPCAAVKAERDAALAQLATANTALAAAQAQVTTLTSERNTARAERDAALGKLSTAKTLATQITAL